MPSTDDPTPSLILWLFFLRTFSVMLVSPYLRGLSQTRREEGKDRYKSLAFSWLPESHSMASASISLSCFSCKSSMEMSSFSWPDYIHPKYSLCLWNGEERMWTGSQHYLPWMCFSGSVSSHMLLVKYFKYVQKRSFFWLASLFSMRCSRWSMTQTMLLNSVLALFVLLTRVF